MTDIDEVKSRLNIVDVISERVPLKKAGRHFKALCPFHNEKTPSFIVSPERQMFKCFGCGRGGSIIDFVMAYEHVDFLEALTTLAEKAGVKLTRRPPETAEEKLKQKIYEVNHLASEFYQYLLTKHALGKRGRAYLKNRGITEKSIKTFSLGYSANSWDGLLKFLTKKGYDGKLLETAGLVIASSVKRQASSNYYDRFRGRVMFTLRDHRGNVVGFSGRLLSPDAKEAKYINTSETPVYSKGNVLYGLDVTREAIKRENEAVVMEGELDVISSFQAGVGNAVAIKGSALTGGHVRLLRRFTERLSFALDSDLAGDAAARRGIELADAAGLDMKVIVLPSGKDPDEAARENPSLLKKAIRDAIPVYDYFISSATRRFDVKTSFGKKKAGDELLPMLSKIENPIVQGHYVKAVARALDSTEESIQEAMKKLAPGYGKPLVRKPESTPSLRRETLPWREKLELYLLALLLQGKTHELFEEFQEYFKTSDVANGAVRNILIRLEKFLKTHQVFLIKDFADQLPGELIATLDEAFLWDTSEIVGQEERFSKEWNKATLLLRREILRQKIQDLTSGIRGPEGKEDALPAIQVELRALTGELKDLEKST